MLAKGEATRQRLIETAAMMFWRTSYHATSMNDVCREAKVNKATAYEHFASKRDLALATIADNQRRTLDYVFEGSLAESVDPRKQLAGIFDRVYETHQGVVASGEPCPGCPFVNIGNELASVDPTIRQRIEAVFADFCAYYEKIVSEAKRLGYLKTKRSNRTLANALVDLMNGAMVSAKIQNRPEALMDAKKNALALITGKV